LKFYIVGIGIFDNFCSCDLDIDPMTFIYELDPYFLEIYQMCGYKRPAFESYRLTDRHTCTCRQDRYYIPRRFAVGQS